MKQADPSSTDVIYEWPLFVPCFVAVLLGVYVFCLFVNVFSLNMKKTITLLEIFCKKSKLKKNSSFFKNIKEVEVVDTQSFFITLK